MGLPQVHRLRHRQDFALVSRRGRRFKATHLHLLVLKDQTPKAKVPSPDPSHPNETIAPVTPSRIGVVVSKRVSKRATQRNRLRRQVQGAFLALRSQLEPGWKLMVTLQPPALECDFWQILQELEQLLTKAEVLHGYSGRGLF